MGKQENKSAKSLILGFIILLILLLICLCFFGIYKILEYILTNFIDWLSTLSSKVDAVIIVALITGMISLITLIITKTIEAKHKRREYLTLKREKPYSEFIDIVYKLQRSNKSKEEYSQEQMIKDISSFSKEITLWGSKKVVTKWVEFREACLDCKQNNNLIYYMEDIMNAMRKDLGLKKTAKGKLLSFFINDLKK